MLDRSERQSGHAATGVGAGMALPLVALDVVRLSGGTSGLATMDATVMPAAGVECAGHAPRTAANAGTAASMGPTSGSQRARRSL